MKPLYHQPLARVICCAFMFTACAKHAAIPLSITAMNPASGPDSTQVTIAGAGFSASVAKDLVSFNGKPATVLSATATSLVVRTPTLAGTGNVTVTVNGKAMTAGLFTYDTTWRQTIISDTISGAGDLSLDKSGNLYVSVFQSSNVYKITPAGAISSFATIQNPLAQTIDPNGNLYVVSEVQYVYKITPAGTKTLIGTEIGDVFGIAVDQNGNAYLANAYNNAVDKMSPQGVVSEFDSVFFRSGIALNKKGTLYVEGSSEANLTGSGLGVIYSMTQPNITTTIASSLDYSGHIQMTFDSSNNLYFTTYSQGTLESFVTRISPDGIITNLPVPDFFGISGIARDAGGNFYVTDFPSNTNAQKSTILKLTMH
jgi:hypothetical protein